MQALRGGARRGRGARARQPRDLRVGQTNGGGRSAEASADLSINQIINKEDISMKKTYETPEVEVVKFQYRDQVVVASGNKCSITDERVDDRCISDSPTFTN